VLPGELGLRREKVCGIVQRNTVGRRAFVCLQAYSNNAFAKEKNRYHQMKKASLLLNPDRLWIVKKPSRSVDISFRHAPHNHDILRALRG
jgi:hypothetical protein